MIAVRRAGSGSSPTGERVTWAMAEGRSGRRWREAVAGGDGLRHSLLLEADPSGRFTHLELATPAGLLSLHPEGDGSLHGNVVTADGVRHIAGLPWGDGNVVVMAGSPVAQAVIAFCLRNAVPPGTSIGRAALLVGLDLRPACGQVRISRLEAQTWQIGDGDPLLLDPDGLPALVDGNTWPMELAQPG